MTARVAGFAPLSDEQVMLVGARDLETQERIDLAESQIGWITVDGLRRAPVRDVVDPVARGLGAHADAVYVHVDVDVHDPSCGGSNHYAPVAGLSAADSVLIGLCAVGGAIFFNRRWYRLRDAPSRTTPRNARPMGWIGTK